MRAFMLAAIAITIAATGCGKTLRPGYCRTDNDCKSGESCPNDGGTFMCTSTDAGTAHDGGEVGEVGDASDASDAPVEKPFMCTTTADCADASMPGVCEPIAGKCVECLPNMADACMGTTPICVGTTCVRCSTDIDCTGPNICMTDGHCAPEGEVVYVEFKQAGCTGADGSAASPYCAPNDGIAALAANPSKKVLVIRGPTNSQLTVGTTGRAPVIIGRKNSTGIDPSVLTGAGTGIQVTSDDVLIRDLPVGFGSMGSKGIVVSGASTKLTMLNLRVETTNGLGVQADNGADLVMDRCYVTNNSAGGLLINGASYSIENSVFAANGFSQVQFSAAPNPGTPRFRFNTVVATTGNAATCDVTNMRTLTDSIVVGGANCPLVNVVPTMQNFKTMPPYHLLGHVECPAAPSMFPSHDIDGEPRVPPIDCGADQFLVQ